VAAIAVRDHHPGGWLNNETHGTLSNRAAFWIAQANRIGRITAWFPDESPSFSVNQVVIFRVILGHASLKLVHIDHAVVGDFQMGSQANTGRPAERFSSVTPRLGRRRVSGLRRDGFEGFKVHQPSDRKRQFSKDLPPFTITTKPLSFQPVTASAISA
jgi:hypothetical protein